MGMSSRRCREPIGSTPVAHSNYDQITIGGKLVKLCRQSDLRRSIEMFLIVKAVEVVRPVSTNEDAS